MTTAVIFDLDMCILDTHSLTDAFFEPVVEVVHGADLSLEVKDGIRTLLWTTSLDDILALFSVPDDIASTMRNVYRTLEIPDGIATFGDEGYIADLPVRKLLVTSGYRAFQEAKLEKLGIAHLFEEIIVDALDNPAQRKGKKKIFEELLQKNGWQPAEVLVVGDNPASELGAAKLLGIPTVQTLRPTIQKWDDATHHISSFSELDALVR